ncbi:hypothetical protein [Kosakonia cowanii]|uniref:hypothetical protein n=1 Tax=Kosakonia cowanii TaxID=208223 RepID=UPI002897E47A|nr:hypothetical protein [Kosakonia cowanii]
MNMDKAIILALLLGFSSASGAAFAGQCPAKGSITSTGVETDTDGISSMVYCSPSATNCRWKGFDPMAIIGSKVKEFLNAMNQPTRNNGLTYCDYRLETGDQIRMSLKHD